MQSATYDAIVVGSGISGGWAAKELTEKGLRVLMLERGRNVEHIKDYVNATKAPWEYLHRGGRTKAMEEEYQRQEQQKIILQKENFDEAEEVEYNDPTPVQVTSPLKSLKIADRNQKVSVRYADGTVLNDVKYKKIEEDLMNNRCVLIQA